MTYLIALWLLTGVLDVVTTAVGLGAGAVEVGPLMSHVYPIWGLAGMVAVKVLVMAPVVAVYRSFSATPLRWPANIGMGIMAGSGVAAVGWNLVMLAKLI